ncbi:hypothetical protein GCM10027290_03050 [Micromonospora sonneratiae]|jgi:hypothetical protein|uniref:Thiazolylpeptide-type bacteriocin n=1 Tax=Micromonospora sonneratiae TaxID=1184706 RepID=A0ABW3Y6J6_9ACTN
MLTGQLKNDLLQIEAETFEIVDLASTAQDLATVPVDAEIGIIADGEYAAAACSSSCSCSSCCSCSTSSCCSTSTSTSSCG